ncbi:MAG: hypothetical protein ABFD89_16975 [Bryobacteraceae bacterium]
MANIKQILATVGKVAAPLVLNTILPGSGGIIQVVEDLLGSKTGTEKKVLATNLAAQILDTLAKSGKLTGAAPALAEIQTAVQAMVDQMKADGSLSENGTMTVAGKTYQITVIGRLPE